MMVVEMGHFNHREWMAGSHDVTETEIQRRICVVLALNMSITNSIDLPTKDTRQHPSGLEYFWPRGVQGLLLHVFAQGSSLDCLARNEDTHSS